MLLTNEIRRQIVKNAIFKIFDQRKKVIVDNLIDLCEVFLVNKRCQKLYRQAPKEWADYIKSSMTVTIKRDVEPNIRIKLNTLFAVLYQIDDIHEGVLLSSYHYAKQVFKNYDSLYSEIQIFEKSINDILRSVNTDKKLQEIAPWLMEFIPSQYTVKKENQLVCIEQINTVKQYFVFNEQYNNGE